MVCYIAGDIGGTNSRLQLWRVRDDATSAAAPASDDVEELKSPGGSRFGHDETLVYEHVYSSQKYASLTFVIDKFLKEAAAEAAGADGDVEAAAASLHPIACCLAVAGPVRANKVTITNVNWELSGQEMSDQLRIPDVLIINDFVGIGYGLLALQRKDVIPINDVPLCPDAPKSCIGAGTGLGEVYLTAGVVDGSDESESAAAEYTVWASEGGHQDFAPRDAIEFGLLEHMKRNERITRVSVERVVSGLGIPKLYNYIAHLHPEEVNPEVTQRLLSEDPGAVIAEFAENGRCNLCRQSIELFVKCYGAHAGNTALKTLPFGGMYLAGGIAPKLRQFLLRNNLFFEHFVRKGRMQTLMEKVPLFIVTHPSVGLLGAKVVCRRIMRRRGFMPGRGSLTTFTEAQPHLLVTQPDESAHLDSPSVQGSMKPHWLAQPEPTFGRSPQPERISAREAAQVRSTSLVYGLIGGALASLFNVAAVFAVYYLTARRRRP